MQTISAQTIFDAVADRAGLVRGEIDQDLFKTLRGALSRRVREGWRYAKWPDLTRIEKRRLRAGWLTSTAYLMGDEVYYAPARKYYCCLRDNSGQAPADGNDAPNLSYWAESQTEYSASDWNATTAYEQGAMVYEPAADAFFQCHTNVPLAGTLTTQTLYWGRLTALDRYVAYEQALSGGAMATKIGDVFAVTRLNPKVHRGPCPVAFSKSENGVQVFDSLAEVWIEFRLRAPVLTGDVYDAARAYAAGAQVYYEDAATGLDGNFYEAPGGAQVGQNPETIGIWDVLEIPLFLERWLVGAVYGDYLESEGQKEKGLSELGMARGFLEEELFVLGAQEGQTERTEVGVR